MESANSARLSKLTGFPRVYEAIDFPGFDEDSNPWPHERVERALKDMVAPKTLTLKEGAQVMLIKASYSARRMLQRQ